VPIGGSDIAFEIKAWCAQLDSNQRPSAPEADSQQRVFGLIEKRTAINQSKSNWLPREIDSRSHA
jgi:hypothetical protein